MKKVLKVLLVIVLSPLIYLGAIILIGTITDYRPPNEDVIGSIEDRFPLNDTSEYSLVIWNIGYAGLGAQMDFFYDGGKNVRDSRVNVEKNLIKIGAWLEQNDSIDFILLQEVDQNSRRSYRINQMEMLRQILPSHYIFSCLNYDVAYIPMPLFKPLGKVKSGLVSFTQHIPFESVRYSFPGNYSWPKGVFLLDRCFMVMRFSVENGKELVLINTHNSAYDDGSLRKEQMEYLRSFLLLEEKKGNHILVGGDWNQCPPGFEDKFTNHVFDSLNLTFVEEKYPAEGWRIAYDATQPTNRRVGTHYVKGLSSVTLIDYFLASPNIKIVSTEVVDLEFENSDHQPVIIKFRLN